MTTWKGVYHEEPKNADALTMVIMSSDLKIERKTILKSELDYRYHSYICPGNIVYCIERKNKKAITIEYLTYHEWTELINGRNPISKYKPNKFLHDCTAVLRLIFRPPTVIAIIIVVGLLYHCSTRRNTEEKSSYTDSDYNYQDKSTPIPTPNPTPSPTPIPEEPLPETGQILKKPALSCVAPFEVETQGSIYNFYIYLKDVNGVADNDISFFVRGGETVEVDVPIGSYKLYYCSGEKWYGTKYRFGSETKYSTSDEIFDFTSDNEYVYGHTITLYKVTNGNLETEEIDEEDFPD